MTADANSSSNNAALLSQEDFDEIILENQEAFDLSPEEALKEAIDQLLLQRNHHEDAGQSTNDCQDVVTNSTAVSRSIPASLLHLSLTHPDSRRGKLDRENRNEFQNNLNFLDGCVKADGTLVSFADDDGAGEDTVSSDNGERTIITKELALEALKLVAHRCQFGDDSDKYIECGCDDNDAANCNNGSGESKSTTLETASMENSVAEIAYSNKLIGSPLPYLTIFHQTSSIYTLMSFLSAMDPSPNSTSEANTLADGINDGHATKSSDVILLETVKTLSAILASPIRTGSIAEKDTSIMLRAELRDSFVPAMAKVVKLIAMYAYITYNNDYHGGMARKHEGECQLQISILISLLQLGLHATRGCEGAKVAFVQSVIPSSLLALKGKDSNNSLSGESKDEGVATVRRGGVKTLVFCLSSFGDVNHCNAPSTLNSSDETTRDKSQSGTVANVKVLHEICQLIASLCRYDDFRDPSFSQQPNPMAGSLGNVSSAHDHAMEFYRAGVLPPLMKIAKGVLVSIRDNGSTVDNCSDLGVGNKQTIHVKSTSMLATVPGVSKNTEIEERLAASCFTALRVLAINDEIVQTMVALGVLPTVTGALELSLSLDEPPTDGNIDENAKKNTKQEINVARCVQFNGRKQRLAAATLGLIRNLCGNDEIKTNLCLGSGSNSVDSPASVAAFSALPYIFQAMKVYSEIAIIQEHACGTLAAMSLRRPVNARAIIDGDGARLILTAMKRHEANVNVQRQGALAVRNIVSRLLMCVNDSGNDSILTDATHGTAFGGEVTSIRESFLEWGAEDVLRNIAGRNQGSVDEAYAALRDLGCPVSLVKFDAQDLQPQGSSSFKSNVDMGVARTMMFGEQHNSNFRPVFEASDGLEDGVDDAIAKFGA